MERILVIEDDSATRMAVLAALRRNGYEVLGAEEGAIGLDLAFTRQPNLILSDVAMPVQDGFDVLRELRARHETMAIPVILMTGRPEKTDSRTSMDQGADDYLQKPFSMEQLLITVRARLHRQDNIAQALSVQSRVERVSTREKLQLQTTALEAAASSIVITDHRGDVLWINPSFTNLTGYSAQDVIGKNLRLLKSGRQPTALYANLWATILAGNVWHGELINKRKDGTFYDEEMTITPVRNKNGEIHNFIAIKQDVSQR